MSQPRKTELWRRQRRQKKLARLRKAYAETSSSSDRKAILDKAIKVAPLLTREVLDKTFQATSA